MIPGQSAPGWVGGIPFVPFEHVAPQAPPLVHSKWQEENGDCLEWATLSGSRGIQTGLHQNANFKWKLKKINKNETRISDILKTS